MFRNVRYVLFFSLFFNVYIFFVSLSTLRLKMSHHLTLLFSNKSIEYLQNLVNFEIKTVHLNLH